MVPYTASDCPTIPKQAGQRPLLPIANSSEPSSVRPLDIDDVARTADGKFDMVVATNVLVYCDRFQQALAMASIAHMLNGGGILLANHVLPARHPDALQYLGRRSVNYSLSGASGDDIVAYQHR
jgi:hypothetical protein